MTQKFKYGDLVHVSGTMPYSMSHFKKDFDAVVMHSYSDVHNYYDPSSDNEYFILDVRDGNRIGWYKEDQLSLIETGREDLIYSWREELRSGKCLNYHLKK